MKLMAIRFLRTPLLHAFIHSPSIEPVGACFCHMCRLAHLPCSMLMAFLFMWHAFGASCAVMCPVLNGLPHV